MKARSSFWSSQENFYWDILKSILIKITGEPSIKRPRISQSGDARVKKSSIPTPNLLNKSDPSLMSDSFRAYFPQKCNKTSEPKIPTKPNAFDQLSDEVIVKIFSYLNHSSLARLSSTCHRFRRIGEYFLYMYKFFLFSFRKIRVYNFCAKLRVW